MTATKLVLPAIGAVLAVLAAGAAQAQCLAPEVQEKLKKRVEKLSSWSTDPQIVAAVKAYNANPPAEAKSMTNERWAALKVLDPAVRSLTRNALAQYLKSKKDRTIAECFVSGADGGKVAFLSKTTRWSHKGSEKHEAPLAGRIWYGPVEVDESSGEQQVQVGLPVLDGHKPIGSIVIGIAVSELD